MGLYQARSLVWVLEYWIWLFYSFGDLDLLGFQVIFVGFGLVFFGLKLNLLGFHVTCLWIRIEKSVPAQDDSQLCTAVKKLLARKIAGLLVMRLIQHAGLLDAIERNRTEQNTTILSRAKHNRAVLYYTILYCTVLYIILCYVKKKR